MDRRLARQARSTDAEGLPVGSDVIGPDVGEGSSPPRRSARGRLLALGGAFLLGFGISHVLDDERRSALARSPEGQLSLALDAVEGPDHVRDPGGRLSVRLSFVVRNNGPVDVVLHSAGLGDLTAADTAGRPVLAGGITRVSMTRRIDCTSPIHGAVPAASLVVEATTPAGARTTRLPLDDDLRGRFDDRLRQACGQVPPEVALKLETPGLLPDAGALRLPLSLTNASADEVILLEARAPDALRVDLRRSDGAPVTLPLSLPGADFSSPSPPEEAVREVTRLEAVLRLTSCQDAPGAQREGPRPLLELLVRSASSSTATTIPYGDGGRAVSRLRAGCADPERTPDQDE